MDPIDQYTRMSEQNISSNGIQGSNTVMDPIPQYTTMFEQNTGSNGIKGSYTATNQIAQFTKMAEHNTSSNVNLLQRRANKTDFTVPQLNTENINLGYMSQTVDGQSPNLIHPPGFSPKTLLDSPDYVNCYFVQQTAPATGEFSHVASASHFVPSVNQSSEDFFREMYASSVGIQPVSNEVTSTNLLHRPFNPINRVSVPAQSLENPTYNIPNQQVGLSEMDTLGFNMLNRKAYSNVGGYMEEHNALDVYQDNINNQSGTGRALAEDGYSWREDGEHRVRGSEHSYRYYKCIYTDCSAKKEVQILAKDHIQKIFHKGLHNHPKLLTGLNSCLKSSSVLNNMPPENSQLDITSTGTGNRDMSLHEKNVSQLNSGTAKDASLYRDGERIESESRKRKIESSIKPAGETKVILQTISDVDLMDDGFRWRKYGQKLVKGKLNPRSYYKCTTANCFVKKQIERSADDVTMVVTTYEGRHTHETPIACNNGHNYVSAYTNQSTGNVLSHMQRNESSQVQNSMGPFNRIPQLGLFPMSAMQNHGTYPDCEYGFNPIGLLDSDPKIGSMQPNQGQLPDIPINQFSSQQGIISSGSHVLPHEEPNAGHVPNHVMRRME